MTNAVYNKESAARMLVANIADCYRAMVINNVKLKSKSKWRGKLNE